MCFKILRHVTGRIKELQLTINTFLTNNINASVSHIQHQNDFYRYGIERLNIKGNIESVSIGTDAIDEIIEADENRHEAERDTKMNLLFGILSVLVVFSALADANTLFDINLRQRFGNPVWIIVMGFITVLAVIVLNGLYRVLKNKQRKR